MSRCAGSRSSSPLGCDAVTFRVPALAPGATISVELQYASLSPGVLDAIAATPTAASLRFAEQTASRPATPVTMTRTSCAW